MVTIKSFLSFAFRAMCQNRARPCSKLDVGGHYSTVLSVSRIGAFVVITAALMGSLPIAARASSKLQNTATSVPGGTTSVPSRSPQAIFTEGETALRNGNLDEAERSFKQVLALDPRAAAAYANLGVIHMRRKQWQLALASLHQAEKLAPQMTGVRLNIGLVHYRQNDFRHAVPALESVVKDSPDSLQARYLLGQCYFFTDRFVEAVDMLE